MTLTVIFEKQLKKLGSNHVSQTHFVGRIAKQYLAYGMMADFSILVNICVKVLKLALQSGLTDFSSLVFFYVLVLT